AIYQAGGSLHLNRCTLDQNVSTGQVGSSGGAAIYNQAGSLYLSQSTLSGNTSSGVQGFEAYGAAVYNAEGATADIRFCTIVKNHIQGRDNSTGGGIYNMGTLTLYQNILALNTRSHPFPNYADAFSTANAQLTSLGYNLIGMNNFGLKLSFGDQAGTPEAGAVPAQPMDPLIQELADNGGFALTHALSPCSPAINSGDPLSTLQSDQRNMPIFDLPDIGAFELEEAANSPKVVTTTADDGPGTLRRLIQDACPGSTIRFDLPPNSSILLSSGQILIDKNLHLIGPGADMLSISGNQQSRIFEIAQGVSVTIDSLMLTGGMTTEDGGAVYNRGNLALYQCELEGNDAGEQSGGAIYNARSLSLTQCSLRNNQARAGGSIFNNLQALLRLTSTEFVQNTAPSFGGGAIYNSTLSEMELTDCTFSQNSGDTGGAIWTKGKGSLNACSFEFNQAQKGGAIFNTSSGGDLSLLHTRLNNNRAFEDGGAIWNFNASLDLQYCLVDTNRAASLTAGSPRGGGLYIGTGNVSIRQSTISRNIAAESFSGAAGGGIFIEDGNLLVENSTISSNRASGRGNGDGGGIFNANGMVSLLHCTLTRNQGTAQNPHGGGLYNGGIMEMGHSILLKNTTTMDFNGPNAFNQGTFTSLGHNLMGTLRDFNFSQAQTDITGFNGNILGPLQSSKEATPFHPLLPCNNPAIDGGASQAVLSMDQRGFVRKIGVAADIGAVEWGSSSDPHPRNFIDEVADGAEGGLRRQIELAHAGDTLYFSQQLNGNTLLLEPDMGQEIFIDKPLVLLGPGADQLTLAVNSSPSRPARMFHIDACVDVHISGLTLSGGMAPFEGPQTDYFSRGGGIWNEGNLSLEEVGMTQHVAPTENGRGGAIYNDSSATLSLSRSALYVNRSGEAGSGLYNLGTATVVNTTVSSNRINGKGGEGAGIYNAGILSVDFCTIARDTATVFGGSRGAGLFNSGELSLSNTIIAYNVSQFGPEDFEVKDAYQTEEAILHDGGFNILSSEDQLGLSRSLSNMFPIEPYLDSLQMDGGSTPVHPLLIVPSQQTGSPAFNAANPHIAPPPTDQRGLPRPFPTGGRADIGAWEYQQVTDTEARIGPLLFSLFPNPFTQELQLHSQLDKSMRAELSIFNSQGQRLWSRTRQLPAGEFSLRLPAGNLPPGLYVLHIAGKDGLRQSIKLVKIAR
ncbi:MAG: T9SS C-terminal target domain-containing protein, partial [Bacteroidetes bacterium]